MNKKALQWLYQQLPELVSKDILTKDAAEKLRQYYGEVKSAQKWFILIICGVLGSLLIGLGIILLLAHNWEQFSRFTRAILSFAPLVIGQMLAIWVLRKRPESDAFKEGTATFLALMVGASIALISQTYNVPGDTADFIFSWMLLIAPLVYLMQATIPAAIYIAGITAWAGHFWPEPLKAILFWPLAAVVVPHFLWSLRKQTYTLRAAILAFVMAICVCFGAGISLGRTLLGSWIIINPSIFAIFYLIGSRKFNNISDNWQRPLHVIGAIGMFVLAFLFTFRFPWDSLKFKSYQVTQEFFSLRALPDYVITFAIVTCAILLFYDHAKRKGIMKSLFAAMPLFAFLGYVFGFTGVVLSVLLFNAYLFAVSVSRIIIGIRSNSLGIVNSGMLMLAILIVARFFDSEINFVIKGLVFITVGIGFLVANALLVHRKGGGR